MSGHYNHLGDVRGLNQRILTRSIRSIVVDDPQRIEGERVAHWVATARMTLDVGVQMTSPQVVGETSELLSVTALRPSDNKVMMRADYE